MTVEGQEVVKVRSNNRLFSLFFLLNLILLGWLLYTTFGRSLTPSGGVSLVLVNDTVSPMIDMTLSFPGGPLKLPRLDPKQSVGNPVQYDREFEAILSFKDEQGNAFQETFRIKPLDELLVVIYALPLLEEATVKTAEGKDEKVLKASTSKIRILTTYRGENNRI